MVKNWFGGCRWAVMDPNWALRGVSWANIIYLTELVPQVQTFMDLFYQRKD